MAENKSGDLGQWVNTDAALEREFTFKTFAEAFAFMKKVAEVAETMQHHPDWSNSYNRVMIKLTTHDAGDKVTEKDWKMARAIDALL
ncbi:MAG: 4a-hydroxytetrahydrobiopterin dehydratase [Proteobacteria bacterium]|nr:4a-hydroxytetrahydrobiopterin dehydratase [Pseudomonadota bacterium]